MRGNCRGMSEHIPMTPPDDTPIVLELQDVTCSYDTGFPAVEGISFPARKGDVICLLGPSGCGKTTTLRAIAGFEPVASGEIRLNGNVVSTTSRHVPPEQRRVGMVFQDYALFPHLTVRDNVGFGLTSATATDRRGRVDEMLFLTGLSEFAGRYPHALSGGQQQRAALARALAPQPVLLLLDEPFSNLDPDTTERMRLELLHLLKSTQTTAVLVTHDHEEAFAMADYVAVLNGGKLEQFSTPETIYHLPVSPFVAEFVGQADFIPGTIRDSAVVTQLGTFPVPPDYRGGPDVSIMIRPDDVHVHENGNGDGTVESRQFRGSEVIYGIRLGSGDVVHSSEASTRFFPLDAKVDLEVMATHTVVFDRNLQGPSLRSG